MKSTTKISRDEKLASCEEYICTWKEEKDCCFDMQRKRTRCACLKEQLTQEPMGKKCYAMLFGLSSASFGPSDGTQTHFWQMKWNHMAMNQEIEE